VKCNYYAKLEFIIYGLLQNNFLTKGNQKVILSKEIQNQLGLKRYETVWVMIHKSQKAMQDKDSRYTLEGMIEFDEGYFTIESSEIEQEKEIRGRGAEEKYNVAVLVVFTPLENIETEKKSIHCRYFKAKVLANYSAVKINEIIQESISEKTVVFSEKCTSCIYISDYVEIHITEKSDKQTTKETLCWVHIAIRNAKCNFLGNHNKLEKMSHEYT
jgi:hypothetical protein